jgi:hypothetical protein
MIQSWNLGDIKRNKKSEPKREEAGRMWNILPAEYEKVIKKVIAFYTY